jgi:hypothetical protein
MDKAPYTKVCSQSILSDFISSNTYPSPNPAPAIKGAKNSLHKIKGKSLFTIGKLLSVLSIILL